MWFIQLYLQCVRVLDFLQLQLFVLHNTDTVSFPISSSRFLRYIKHTETSPLRHCVLPFKNSVSFNSQEQGPDDPCHVQGSQYAPRDWFSTLSTFSQVLPRLPRRLSIVLRIFMFIRGSFYRHRIQFNGLPHQAPLQGFLSL